MADPPLVRKKSKAIQPPGRREPHQARARHTRALIFETALTILEEEGLEALSTNHIAARSGFGVGTIYQYFVNKEQILRALAHEEQRSRLERIRRALAAEGTAGRAQGEARIRAVLRIVLDAFGGRHRARKILLELALRDPHRAELERPVLALAQLLERAPLASAPGRAGLSQLEAFTLTQAVAGVIRAALARDPTLLRKRELEDALVRLTVGFLAPARPSRDGGPLPKL
jgi:AcrR family transcriptional regulator